MDRTEEMQEIEVEEDAIKSFQVNVETDKLRVIKTTEYNYLGIGCFKVYGEFV